MIITVQRVRHNQQCSLGHLSCKDQAFCTLEPPPQKAKIWGHTRIPAGQYVLKLRTEGALNAHYIERFGGGFHHGMLWLQEVPDFEDVYIHIGNYPQDTEGCILIGKDYDGDAMVTQSEEAYRAFYPAVASAIMAGEEVMVDVIDEVS